MFDKKTVTTTATIYNLMFFVTGNLWYAQCGCTFPYLENASPVDVQSLDILCTKHGALVFYYCITNDHKHSGLK